MIKIAVLVSGGGTNLQALIDAQAAGQFENGQLSLVVSSNSDAYALTRAEKASIPTQVMKRNQYASTEQYGEALGDLLESHGIGLIVLAGFMTVLSDRLCRRFPNRIINVHPSLIPSFCGEGYYGLRVHKAALKKGVKITGATIHFVSEIVDGGAIIAQKAVDVKPTDTPESLQKRVMKEAEHVLLPRVVSQICMGAITTENGKVRIADSPDKSGGIIP